MKKKNLLSCLILFWISITLLSCATVPTGPLTPGELRLLSMNVLELHIDRGIPFKVDISFEADGKPQIKGACFYWSGEGPYCMRRNIDVQYGTLGHLTLRLITNNPGNYILEGYVEYIRDGKIQITNRVASTISVHW